MIWYVGSTKGGRVEFNYTMTVYILSSEYGWNGEWHINVLKIELADRTIPQITCGTHYLSLRAIQTILTYLLASKLFLAWAHRRLTNSNYTLTSKYRRVLNQHHHISTIMQLHKVDLVWCHFSSEFYYFAEFDSLPSRGKYYTGSSPVFPLYFEEVDPTMRCCGFKSSYLSRF